MTRLPEAFLASSNPVSRFQDGQRQAHHPQRNHHERLLELARTLPAADRVLMEQVYRHGTSVADLARLARCSRGQMYRRLTRIVKRMQHPFYRFMLTHGDLLPQPTRRVAELLVFHGLSLRRAAKVSGQTLHVVRMHWFALRALAHR